MVKFSIQALKEFVKGVPWKNVIQKSKNTEQGQRLFPSRTPNNDHKSNFRVDRGAQVGDKYEVILQANKNAKNPGVKAEAAKNSHKIWAKALVDPLNPDSEQVEADLLASFRNTE